MNPALTPERAAAPDLDDFTAERQFVRGLHAVNPAKARTYVDYVNSRAKCPDEKSLAKAVVDEHDLISARALSLLIDTKDGAR